MNRIHAAVGYINDKLTPQLKSKPKPKSGSELRARVSFKKTDSLARQVK